jgi:hypothetical protein
VDLRVLLHDFGDLGLGQTLNDLLPLKESMFPQNGYERCHIVIIKINFVDHDLLEVVDKKLLVAS